MSRVPGQHGESGVSGDGCGGRRGANRASWAESESWHGSEQVNDLGVPSYSSRETWHDTEPVGGGLPRWHGLELVGGRGGPRSG